MILTSAPEVSMPHLRARQHQYSNVDVGMVPGLADDGLREAEGEGPEREGV